MDDNKKYKIYLFELSNYDAILETNILIGLVESDVDIDSRFIKVRYLHKIIMYLKDQEGDIDDDGEKIERDSEEIPDLEAYGFEPHLPHFTESTTFTNSDRMLSTSAITTISVPNEQTQMLFLKYLKISQSMANEDYDREENIH